MEESISAEEDSSVVEDSENGLDISSPQMMDLPAISAVTMEKRRQKWEEFFGKYSSVDQEDDDEVLSIDDFERYSQASFFVPLGNESHAESGEANSSDNDADDDLSERESPEPSTQEEMESAAEVQTPNSVKSLIRRCTVDLKISPISGLSGSSSEASFTDAGSSICAGRTSPVGSPKEVHQEMNYGSPKLHKKRFKLLTHESSTKSFSRSFDSASKLSADPNVFANQSMDWSSLPKGLMSMSSPCSPRKIKSQPVSPSLTKGFNSTPSSPRVVRSKLARRALAIRETKTISAQASRIESAPTPPHIDQAPRTNVEWDQSWQEQNPHLELSNRGSQTNLIKNLVKKTPNLTTCLNQGDRESVNSKLRRQHRDRNLEISDALTPRYTMSETKASKPSSPRALNPQFPPKATTKFDDDVVQSSLAYDSQITPRSRREKGSILSSSTKASQSISDCSQLVSPQPSPMSEEILKSGRGKVSPSTTQGNISNKVILKAQPTNESSYGETYVDDNLDGKAPPHQSAEGLATTVSQVKKKSLQKSRSPKLFLGDKTTCFISSPQSERLQSTPKGNTGRTPTHSPQTRVSLRGSGSKHPTSAAMAKIKHRPTATTSYVRESPVRSPRSSKSQLIHERKENYVSPSPVRNKNSPLVNSTKAEVLSPSFSKRQITPDRRKSGMSVLPSPQSIGYLASSVIPQASEQNPYETEIEVGKDSESPRAHVTNSENTTRCQTSERPQKAIHVSNRTANLPKSHPRSPSLDFEPHNAISKVAKSPKCQMKDASNSASSENATNIKPIKCQSWTSGNPQVDKQKLVKVQSARVQPENVSCVSAISKTDTSRLKQRFKGDGLDYASRTSYSALQNNNRQSFAQSTGAPGMLASSPVESRDSPFAREASSTSSLKTTTSISGSSHKRDEGLAARTESVPKSKEQSSKVRLCTLCLKETDYPTNLILPREIDRLYPEFECDDCLLYDENHENCQVDCDSCRQKSSQVIARRYILGQLKSS